MENRSHALLTGFFTIALLVAAVLAGVWFNRDRIERVPYEIATTQSIPGLNPQAAVRYRGLEVGKVDAISFDPKVAGQILIRLAIDEEAPVTRTTFATLGYQGVTGIAFIQLDDDRTGSPRLGSAQDNPARIPLRPGLLDQLEKRGTAILDKADQLTTRLNNMLSEENERIIVGAFDEVGKTARAYAAIPEQLDPTLERLPALTRKLETSMANFDELSASATRAARNYDQLATSLQAPNGPIARLNDTIDQVGGSVQGVVAEVEMETLPQINTAAGEIRTSLRAVRRTANTFGDRPQSLLFGAPSATPGPGEPGFEPPTK